MKKNIVRAFLIILCLLLIPFPAFAVNEDYIPIHIDGYYDDWADKAPTEVYPGKNPPLGKINYVKLFRDESKVYVYVQFAYKNNQDITNMIINLYTNMGDENYFIVPDHWFNTTDTTIQDMAPGAESNTDSIQQDLLTEGGGGAVPADQSLTPEQGGGTGTTEPGAPAGQNGTESVEQNTDTTQPNTDTTQPNTDTTQPNTDTTDQNNNPDQGGSGTGESKVYANLEQETYMLVADNADNQGNNNSAADSAVTTDSTEKTNNGQGNGTDATDTTNNGQSNGTDTTDKTNNGQGNGPVDLTNPATSLDDVLNLLDPMNPETLTNPEDILNEIISDTPADPGADTTPTDSGIETGTTPATDSGIDLTTGSGIDSTTDTGIGLTTDSGIVTTTDTGIGADNGSGINQAPNAQNGNLDLKKPGYYGTWSFTVWSGLHPVGSGFYTRTEGAQDELELYIPLSSIVHQYDGITEITMRIKKLGPQMIMCAGASTEPYIGVMIGAGIAVLSAGAYSYKKKRPFPFDKRGKVN